MLRGPQDRSHVNINLLRDLIKRCESWVESVRGRLIEFIESMSGEAIITYSGLGSAAASTLYWILSTAYPDANITVFDSDTIAHFRLAYRKRSSIIHFSSRRDDPAIIRLSDASRLTGSKLMIVTPRPIEILEELLRGTPYIEVPMLKTEAETGFYETMLALHAGIIAARKRGKRFGRLEKFISEGYEPVIKEFLEKYQDIVRELKSTHDIIVSSSGFLEPHAHAIVMVLRERGTRASYIPLTQLKPMKGENILIIATSVEESIVKEKRFKGMASGARIIDFVLNVDPLEAPIYIQILSLSLVC